MKIKANVWTTKENFTLSIRDMATPHLLATIHMIERKRCENLTSIGMSDGVDKTIIDYYAKWHPSYEALLDEAERRGVIGRTGSKVKKLKEKNE